MSIESSAAPSNKSAGAVEYRGGKNIGKADVASSDASGGFSALMTRLSAADSAADGSADTNDGDKNATRDVSGIMANSDQIVPIPQSGLEINAINIASMSGTTDAVPVSADSQLTGSSGLTLDANGGFQRSNRLATLRGTPLATVPGSLPISGQKSLTGQVDVASEQVAGLVANVSGVAPEANRAVQGKRLVVSSVAGSASSVPADTDAARRDVAAALSEVVLGVAGPTIPAPAEFQTGVKGVALAQTDGAAQAELKEVKAYPATLDLAARSETTTVAIVNGATDSLLKLQERVAVKPTASRSDDVGQGGVGGTSGVNARADKPYEIEATAAAVPDTAVAETVSYWVTQGVQTAEMTLDGFGSDPVKVSISLNGDQAQIDFRTDQADVRQALEAATADLRNLLSSEGLQLTGVSVGSSGGRSTRDDAQQANPGATQVALIPELVATPVSSRNINASVGRSLDLYV